MKMQKHWYLGFLGLVGIYMLPNIVGVFTGEASLYKLLNLLWFFWFTYFVPESGDKGSES